MGIINKYRIKPGVTMADIENELKNKRMPFQGAATYIHPSAIRSTFYHIIDEISVNIGFPADLSTWDSFDHVLVIDEDFGQPYQPFYMADEDEKWRFSYSMNVVGHYNKFMDTLGFLERTE